MQTCTGKALWTLVGAWAPAAVCKQHPMYVQVRTWETGGAVGSAEQTQASGSQGSQSLQDKGGGIALGNVQERNGGGEDLAGMCSVQWAGTMAQLRYSAPPCPWGPHSKSPLLPEAGDSADSYNLIFPS